MPVYKVISKFHGKSYPFFISELKRAITTHDGDGNKNVKKAIDLVHCKTVRIFAYSSTCEQSNERSGTKLKTESETGEKR